MSKVIVLAVAVLLIGAVTVGMYEYLQDANLDKWGSWTPMVQLAPVLFVAAGGAGGVIVYAFVRKGR